MRLTKHNFERQLALNREDVGQDRGNDSRCRFRISDTK